MDLASYSKICYRPNIFARATLERTVHLLRPTHPSLALSIQNILVSSPVEKPEGLLLTTMSDHFQVELTHDQTSRIIEALTDINLENANYEAEKARDIVMLRTLICEWLDLAKTLLYDEEHLLSR